MNIVWIASYPRSGNTFLRTILWQCFGVRTGSAYPSDFGGNKALENYVGHIEYRADADGIIRFDDKNIPLVKTHEYPTDTNAAIYVIRDGRAASVSLWHFYKGQLSLNEVIEGQHRFGKWSDHVRAWKAYKRPNTLLLKYEDMKNDLPTTLKMISAFLKIDIRKMDIPDRANIASVDGCWVRNNSDWRAEFPKDLLDRFNEQNKVMLKKMGYM